MQIRLRILYLVLLLSASVNSNSVAPVPKGPRGALVRVSDKIRSSPEVRDDLTSQCIAGFAAGLVKYVFVHPLDTITTLFEVASRLLPAFPLPQSHTSSAPHLKTCSTEERWLALGSDVGGMTKKVGIGNAIKMRSVAKGGASLWAGLPSTMALGLPFAVLFHSGQGATSMWVHEAGLTLGSFEPLVAATVGSVLASLVGVPMEVVKHRTQLLGSDSALRVAGAVLRAEGPIGLYRGSAATLVRNVVYNGVQWTSFATTRAALAAAIDGCHGARGRKPKGDMALLDLAAGMAAGVATAVCTQPIDCVNTRLQTQGLIEGGAARYTGMVDCWRRTVAHEGSGALFRGLAPRALTFSVGGAFFFFAYEACYARVRRHLHEHRPQVG